MVKGEQSGDNEPKDIQVLRFTFSKDGQLSINIMEATSKNAPEILHFKIIGAGKIDFGPEKRTFLGIYKFEGDDRLTMCWDEWQPGKRPTEFSSPKGSRNVLQFLERAKADDKLTPAQETRLKQAAAKVELGASRTQNASNLTQIAFAFHRYHDEHKHFPAHAIYSKDGKTPLLSWRVAILPHLKQQNLYEKFKLDEPWDSEHNKKLIPLNPQIYQSPFGASSNSGLTYYQVFTGPDTLFDGSKHMTLDQITNGDGTSNTILTTEGAEPVIWTKPADLQVLKEKEKMPAIGGFAQGDPQVAICDCSAWTIRRDLAPAILRALVTPRGGEEIDWSKIVP